MSRASLLVVILSSLVVDCRKVEEPTPPPKAAAPAPKVASAPKEPAPKSAATAKAKLAEFHTPILAAMSKAGLKVGVLEQTAARPYSAKACVQGEVEQLDVLLCSFDGEAAATAAEKSVEPFLAGATTGVVRRRGSVLIAVADRKKSDLRGRQISKLLQAFTTPSS
jgi:hypothetical protein